MTSVVHIVPVLPPPLEGVSGYALALAEALRDRYEIDSAFVAAAALPTRTPDALRAALAALTDAESGKLPIALLHYAGYGFHPRGCPDWLVEGLEAWEGRLVTAFHEVWATGPPWRSSFWLSPWQRRLAGRLARRSDGLVTSMGLYRRNLLRRAPGREVTVMPVFSTVGEPAAVLPLDRRNRCLVLFGGPGVRGRAWRHSSPALDAACDRLGLTEIWDIGPPAEETPDSLRGRPVRRLGPLPASEVSQRLLSAVAGFVAYPAPFLAKSTVFAAYCAHGMLPISAWHRPRRRVEHPPPFWRPAAVPSDDPQRMADRARDWYSRHTLDRCAEAYGRLLLT